MSSKPFYIVGNWKSNKTPSEASAWFEEFNQLWQSSKLTLGQNFHVVLCPPYIHLVSLKQMIDASDIPIELGCQDISGYPQGAYTGEINAQMVKGLVKYVVIGHSERRKYFQESDEPLTQKLQQAKQEGLTSIYCVQDENMPVPLGCTLVGYEPVWAIGTGKADTPENANRVATIISQKNPGVSVVYGGSVTPDNVATYATQSHISGVIPGGASLSAQSFFHLIQNAAQA